MTFSSVTMTTKSSLIKVREMAKRTDNSVLAISLTILLVLAWAGKWLALTHENGTHSLTRVFAILFEYFRYSVSEAKAFYSKLYKQVFASPSWVHGDRKSTL